MKNILLLNILLLTISCSDSRDKSFVQDNTGTLQTSCDTLIVVSSSGALYFPFGMFKNYGHLKKYYPEFCSKKGEFYYLRDGDSYAKLFRDNNTESLGLIYANIHSSKIRLVNGVEIGMSKQKVFGKFFKTLPGNLDTAEVLKVEFVRGGIWHYYNFDNDTLISVTCDTGYQGEKN